MHSQPAIFPLRPGERLIAGKVTIFNLDLLNAHVADEAVEAAGDVTQLTDEALTSLFYNWLNCHARRKRDPKVDAIGRAICNERQRRNEAQATQRAA